MVRHVHRVISIICTVRASSLSLYIYSCCSLDLLLFFHSTAHARLLGRPWITSLDCLLRRDKVAVCAKTQSLPSRARGETDKKRDSKAWLHCVSSDSSANIEARNAPCHNPRATQYSATVIAFILACTRPRYSSDFGGMHACKHCVTTTELIFDAGRSLTARLVACIIGVWLTPSCTD